MCIGVKLQKWERVGHQGGGDSRSLSTPGQKAEPYRCGRPVEPPHGASSSHFRGVNRLNIKNSCVRQYPSGFKHLVSAASTEWPEHVSSYTLRDFMAGLRCSGVQRRVRREKRRLWFWKVANSKRFFTMGNLKARMLRNERKEWL